MPASIDYIEQLDCAKLLGVILQGNLKMDSHIQYIGSVTLHRATLNGAATCNRAYEMK